MTPLRLGLATVGALFAVACAKEGSAALPDLPGAPKKPSVEVRRDSNADQAFLAAAASAQGQPKRKQVEIYLSVRKAYPATTASEEALYRAGVLSFELG